MTSTTESAIHRDHADNPKVASEDRAALSELAEREFQDLSDRQQDTSTRPRLAAAKRLNDSAREWAQRNIPNFGDEMEELERERSARIADAFERWPVVPLDVEAGDAFAPRSAGWGEFWWSNSEWHWYSGLGVDPRADGLHFFGKVDYRGDPLLRFSTGVIAHFALGPDRRPPSASGRYRSAPSVSIRGQIGGFQGFYHPLWAADDKWCKCWMVLRQTAWQFAHNATWVQLGENFIVENLFDLENEYGVAQANPTFQGFRPAPAIEFVIADPAAIIWVQSELRFDFQLEGNATIGLSPGATPDNSVVVHHPQWHVTPL
ncbi:hypothetical protein ACFYVR_10080 [Rhodococcus sp. NPDC003318]|uniref:hypothetical protein n=1 Tax=Rhodococcus sp. NPDC003318 TaxID=3364503 RepID=UPI0036B23FC7